MGVTCMACGLVFQPGPRYGEAVPRRDGKGRLVRSSKPFHRGMATSIGGSRERRACGMEHLARVQAIWTGYGAKKRARILAGTRRLAHQLHLPAAVVERAMDLYGRVRDHLPPRKRSSGTAVLPPVLLHFAARLEGWAVSKVEILPFCNIDTREFNRGLLVMARLAREHAPGLVPACRSRLRGHLDHQGNPGVTGGRGSMASGLARASGILNALHPGVNFAGTLRSLVAMLGSRGASLSYRSKAGVLAYLAIRCHGLEASPSAIATKLGYQPSSLYNAISRLLDRLGITREAGLGGCDFTGLLDAGRA